MNPLVGPLVSLLVDVFKRRRMIREEVLPLIEQAGAADSVDGLTINNALRRQIVLKALTDRGLSESEARHLTEIGLALYKRLQAKAAKKAARKARRAGIEQPDAPATLHRPNLGEPPE